MCGFDMLLVFMGFPSVTIALGEYGGFVGFPSGFYALVQHVQKMGLNDSI